MIRLPQMWMDECQDVLVMENRGRPWPREREGPAPMAWEGWSEAEVFQTSTS